MNKLKNNTSKKRFKKDLIHDSNSQLIVLMGVMFVISVVVIASLAVEISDINVYISSERAVSPLAEFSNIKEAFGRSLNYNIVDVNITNWTYRSLYYGDPDDIPNAFDETKEDFFMLALKHGMFFDVELNDYWYSHPGNNGDIYYVSVTLVLDNGEEFITEDEVYTIVIRPYIEYYYG